MPSLPRNAPELTIGKALTHSMGSGAPDEQYPIRSAGNSG